MQAPDAAIAPRAPIWLPRLDIPHFLESLAVAFSVCVVQTLFVFGLRVDSWLHEVSRFLDHYEQASLLARTPVNFVLVIGFGLNLTVVIIARRNRDLDHD